ncbi:MAG: hypothetical protein GY826_16265 [Fuerstiella sp.]|nr:hypothetical protein [Fuerstiella sp.]
MSKECTMNRMAIIFNTWAQRYADSPDGFSDVVDADGKAIEDYGERCAVYFNEIAQELDEAGLLPRPPAIP